MVMFKKKGILEPQVHFSHSNAEGYISLWVNHGGDGGDHGDGGLQAHLRKNPPDIQLEEVLHILQDILADTQAGKLAHNQAGPRMA
jgi:hypothetical protein